MKNMMMVIFLAMQSAFAASPPQEVISACLLGSDFQAVHFLEIASSESYEYEEKLRGFTRIFMIKSPIDKNEVGFASGKQEAALVFGEAIYPLRKAVRLDAKTDDPYVFFPALAQWATVKNARHNYLCVRFNFDGIGRSGTFQNTFGIYLLSKTKPRVLYYAVGDVRNLEAK